MALHPSNFDLIELYTISDNRYTFFALTVTGCRFYSTPKERVQFRLGAAVANVLNHANYLPRSLDFGTSNSNTISNVRTVDAADPQQMILRARIAF
jgi:hypothetical protein